MNKSALWLISIIMLLFSVPSWGALGKSYSIFYLNLSTGMPSNYVDDVYHDSDGYIWISTHNSGLLRYDGYSFVSFGLSGNPMLRLRSNSAHNVVEDKNHRLWVAFEEGVQAIDMRSGLVADFKTTDDNVQKALTETLNKPCMKVYCDSKGCIWIIRVDEISRIAFDEDGAVSSVLTLKHNTKVAELGVVDIDNDGSIYIGINFRINKISARGNRLVVQDLSARYPQITGCVVGDIIQWMGKIWFATNRGVYCSDSGNTGWHSDGTESGLQNETVTSLAVSPSGKRLFIGTLGGVDVMGSDFKISEHWNVNSPENRLASNFVNNLLVCNGQIWIGTETGGITHLVPRQLLVHNFVHSDENAASIPTGPVNAMYTAPNGDLWVGNVEGGLSLKKADSYDFQHFTTANSNLRHNTVSVLTADDDGNLWIGTWGGGVAMMSLAHPGDIVPLDFGQKYAADLQFIGAMAYDKYNKGIWIGANAGLFFYDLRSHQLREPFPDCRSINGAIGSIVTRDGYMLMGCLPGMVAVNVKKGPDRKGHFEYSHIRLKLDHPGSGAFEKITSFCQGRDGTLWIGSNGYGFYRAFGPTYDTLKIKDYTTDDGLTNNSVKGIVEDKQGMLWIATEHGLSRFNPKTGTFNSFNTDDGLLSDQYYFNGAAISPQGTVYLGTDQGLTMLLGVDAENVYSGQLRITAVSVNNQYALPGSGYLDQAIGTAKKITVHESDRNLTFEFSALNFDGSDQGAYSYRMKGYDNDWIVVQPGGHRAHYSTLPPGHYTFEVRYASSLGNSDIQTTSVEVVVRPYFWKSWWFVTIVVIALVILTHYLYSKKLARMRSKEAEELYRPIEAALKESSEPGKLQERIQDILKNQERYRQSQRKTFEEDRKASVESLPEEVPFMDRLMEVVEKHYTDSELNVKVIAEELGMTRTDLSRRLQTEVGETTTQFIRNYRLDMAKQMLEDNVAERNVTEIAYRVGFNDPKYFTRCFSQRFGVKPSKYKKN